MPTPSDRVTKKCQSDLAHALRDNLKRRKKAAKAQNKEGESVIRNPEKGDAS